MTRLDKLFDICNDHPILTVMIIIVFPVSLFLPVLLWVLDETDK